MIRTTGRIEKPKKVVLSVDFTNLKYHFRSEYLADKFLLKIAYILGDKIEYTIRDFDSRKVLDEGVIS